MGGLTKQLNSVFFTSKNTGWVVGNSGTILKSENGGGNFIDPSLYSYVIDNKNNEQPKDFILYQNYPNPFKPGTVISYRLAVSSKVTLNIYDTLGREVAEIVNEVKLAGTYKVKFNASKLSSGVYFYQIKAIPQNNGTAGVFTETKKLLLLK